MGCCGKVAHGVSGIARSMLGIGTVTPNIIKARRDECRECEFATRNPQRLDRPSKGLTTLSMCRKCDCFIAPKTTLANEKCPIGKWAK